MRVRTSDEREAKLPKWAQDELALLRANLKYYQDKVRSVEQGTSGVYFGSRSMDNRVYIPDNRVTFELPFFEAELDVTREDIGADQHLSIYGPAGTLRIEPRASNVIHVRVK